MRDLPRAIAISCVIVLLIYVLTIVSFHTTLSKSEVSFHCSHCSLSHHPFVNALPMIHFHNSLHGVDHFLAFTSPDIRLPPRPPLSTHCSKTYIQPRAHSAGARTASLPDLSNLYIEASPS